MQGALVCACLFINIEESDIAGPRHIMVYINDTSTFCLMINESEFKKFLMRLIRCTRWSRAMKGQSVSSDLLAVVPNGECKKKKQESACSVID